LHGGFALRPSVLIFPQAPGPASDALRIEGEVTAAPERALIGLDNSTYGPAPHLHHESTGKEGEISWHRQHSVAPAV